MTAGSVRPLKAGSRPAASEPATAASAEPQTRIGLLGPVEVVADGWPVRPRGRHVLGLMDGGAIGLLAAAAHPDRISAVVTYACFAAYDLLRPGADALFRTLRAQLEAGIIFEEALPLLAPGRAADEAFARWMGRYLRMATGIGGAAAVLDRFQDIDIRPVLPRVSVPVLALHRAEDRIIPAANATYLAAHVRDGRAVILPGSDSVIWAGDVGAVASEVERFLWGSARQGG